MPQELFTVPPGKPALEAIVPYFPPHWAPLLSAAQNGVALMRVLPGREAFSVPTFGRSLIVVGADLPGAARGIDAFHEASLRRLVENAASTVLMISLHDSIYAAAALAAETDPDRAHVVIVEASPDYEATWTEALKRWRRPSAGLAIIAPSSSGGPA